MYFKISNSNYPSEIIGKEFSNIQEIENYINNDFINILISRNFNKITNSFKSKIIKNFEVILNYPVSHKYHISDDKINIDKIILNVKSTIKSKKSLYYYITKAPTLTYHIEIIDKNIHDEILIFEKKNFSYYRWIASTLKAWQKTRYWEKYNIELQGFFNKKILELDKFANFYKEVEKFLNSNIYMKDKYMNYTKENIVNLQKYAISVHYIFNKSLFKESEFINNMMHSVLKK